jgi:hypothetical protein
MEGYFTVSIQRIFTDGKMTELDLPREIYSRITSPFDCAKNIRDIFGENGTPNIWCNRCPKEGCIQKNENLLMDLPRDINDTTYIMLVGPRCRCKLYISKEKG